MIFDDWKSWFHFCIGFVAGFSIWFSLLFSILLGIIFGIYQGIESDSISEVLCDVTEFSIGFVAGCVVFHLCRFFLNLAF
jgi:ABC-type dipeptide/oligopeptide/nickel transport system permease component